MHQQNLQLEQEAQALAQRLDAVMQDKFTPRASGFDADTPIDKTLNFLQAFIAVSPFPLLSGMSICRSTAVFGVQQRSQRLCILPFLVYRLSIALSAFSNATFSQRKTGIQITVPGFESDVVQVFTHDQMLWVIMHEPDHLHDVPHHQHSLAI